MSTPSHPTKSRPAPLSIRFTDSEKAQLLAKAAGVPLGTFIRQVVLNDAVVPRRARQTPLRDGDALGQLLGLLGQSRIANNLNQLAKAANLGALPVSKDTEADLKIACAAVFEMRRLLLAALGLRIIADARDTPPLNAAFTDSAGTPAP